MTHACRTNWALHVGFRSRYRDCDGACFSATLGPSKELLIRFNSLLIDASSWLGDGWCDSGAQGINFNCSAWRFDDGDC